MWALKNESTSEFVYFLTDREYTVGRKDSDITIVNDVSVSRKHAILRVHHTEASVGDPKKKSVLILKDISKLGTQLSNSKERISNGAERPLQHGDKIIFGTSSTNGYIVVNQTLLVTTSCLSSSEKKDMKKMVFRLGGHLVSGWCHGCTHVVMSNLSVTIKVASALLAQSLIVSPVYFTDLIAAIEMKNACKKLPPPEDYLPIMAESQVNPSDVSFSPLPQRSSMFSGKVFIFLMKEQFDRLRPVIELGSGDSQLVDVLQEVFDLKESERAMLLCKNNCVMLPESNENSCRYQGNIQFISKILNKSKLRMIPESEIGFAVLHCNTELYCNSSSQNQDLRVKTAEEKTELSASQVTFATACKSDSVIQSIVSPIAENSATKVTAIFKKKPDSIPILQQKRSITNIENPQDEIAHIKCEPISQTESNLVMETSESCMYNDQADVRIASYEKLNGNKSSSASIEATVEKCSKKLKTSHDEKRADFLTQASSLGFLTTDDINYNLKNLEFEAELKVEGVTVVEERKLVFLNKNLQPRASDENDEAVSNRPGFWNGKQVQNYKKFCKSGNSKSKETSLALPRIIGGRALVPHINSDVYDAITSEAFGDLD